MVLLGDVWMLLMWWWCRCSWALLSLLCSCSALGQVSAGLRAQELGQTEPRA